MQPSEREAIAWAAGFLEGDGCISHAGRYPMVSVSGVDQEVLDRFRSAVGAGRLSGPHERKHADRWSVRPLCFLQIYKETQQVVSLLWPYLGTAKRAQALAALEGRNVSRSQLDFGLTSDSRREKLAWAAGFFDAEGCFSTTPRTGVCATITQTEREPLDRFLGAVRIGKIYGPYETHAKDRYSRKPHYFFRVQGRERVQALLAMLWDWLGSTKRNQGIERLDWPTTCHNGHRKRPGHHACGECTREYWARYRGATPSQKARMSKRARLRS